MMDRSRLEGAVRRVLASAAGAALLWACSGQGQDASVTTVATPTVTTTPPVTTTVVVAAVTTTTTTTPTTTERATTTAAPTSTSTTIELPTTTIDLIEGGKIAYYAASSEANKARDDLKSLFTNTVPPSKMRAFCMQLEAIDTKFMADLQAAVWPVDAQDEIDALVLAEAKFVQEVHTCAIAPSGAAAVEIWNGQHMRDVDDAAGDASTAARLALGLPVTRD